MHLPSGAGLIQDVAETPYWEALRRSLVSVPVWKAREDLASAG